MTTQELWDVVNKADTLDEIQDAEKIVNASDADIDTYDDLMNALAYKTREWYHEGRY
jgi:hypothetical protein